MSNQGAVSPDTSLPRAKMCLHKAAEHKECQYGEGDQEYFHYMIILIVQITYKKTVCDLKLSGQSMKGTDFDQRLRLSTENAPAPVATRVMNTKQNKMEARRRLRQGRSFLARAPKNRRMPCGPKG